MDARARKLAIKLGDAELAEKLVQAGIDSPAKIKNAKDADLKKLKGIGPGTLKKIRAQFPSI